jgi:hypothetical protein
MPRRILVNPLKKERKQREEREREGEDEKRLEREAPSRCFSL